MTRAARCSLLLLGALSLPGCQIGALSRFDGEWPVPDATPRHELAVVGDGPGGLLLHDRSGPSRRYLLIAGGNERTLSSAEAIGRAWVGRRVLFRQSGTRVLRHPLLTRRIAPGEAVAEAPDLRGFAVLPAGKQGAAETLLLRRDRSVEVSTGGERRELWRGEALVLAADPGRRAVWIAAAAPLPLIDCVRVADGEVLHRLPLPLELERPSLRLVVSEGNLVAYTPDQPLGIGIVAAPDQGAVACLGSAWQPELPGGRSDPRADPPLLLPPGQVQGERLSVRALRGNTAGGRIAPFPGGRFVVSQDGEFQPWVIAPPPSPGAPPSATLAALPEAWAGGIPQLLRSDRSGAYLLADGAESLVHLRSDESEELRPYRRGGVFRRGFNYGFNGLLALGEAAVFAPTNAVLGVAAFPFGFVALGAGEPALGAALFTAPVWMPVGMTFGFFHF